MVMHQVTTHAPLGDDNQEFAGRRMGREELQSTPRQGTTIPYDPYDYELQSLPRQGTAMWCSLAKSSRHRSYNAFPVRGRRNLVVNITGYFLLR